MLSEYERARAILAREVGSRVVAVGAFYGDDEQRPRDFFTAHFFDFGGQWAMVTAGHCFAGILENRARGLEPSLVYVYDPNHDSKVPLPIRLEYERMVALADDSGIDYGFVPINSMYSTELARVGVRPCAIENVVSPDVPFNTYFLVGYPWEHTSFRESEKEMKMTIAQTVLQLTPLSEEDHKPFQRLQFVCNLDHSPDLPDLSRIEGMSGGLVIGIRHATGNTAEVGIVGIQSTWIEKRRRLFVCPHSSFFNVIRNHVS